MAKFFAKFKNGKGPSVGNTYKPLTDILLPGKYKFIRIDARWAGNGNEDSPFTPILLMKGPEGEKTYAADYFFPRSDFDVTKA